MQAIKHSIYFSGSWRDEQKSLNMAIVKKLATEHGLLVVADHKKYQIMNNERGLDYEDRVDEILHDCSGMVVVFPRREYSQTTAPYMFVEILLATKYKLPILVFYEVGVKLKLEREGSICRMNFGEDLRNKGQPIRINKILQDGFIVETLQSVHSVELENITYINNPICLSKNEYEFKKQIIDIDFIFEEFTNHLIPPQNPTFTFCIMPYSMKIERDLIKRVVFRETGLQCVSGSDPTISKKSPREEIYFQITNAKFVIGDVTGVRKPCVYEVGIAVGSQRDTFLVKKGKNKSLPFGLDRLKPQVYSNKGELESIIKEVCASYNRRIFNIELFNEMNETERERNNLILPDWYVQENRDKNQKSTLTITSAVFSISTALLAASIVNFLGETLPRSIIFGVSSGLALFGLFLKGSSNLQTSLIESVENHRYKWYLVISTIVIISIILIFKP